MFIKKEKKKEEKTLSLSSISSDTKCRKNKTKFGKETNPQTTHPSLPIKVPGQKILDRLLVPPTKNTITKYYFQLELSNIDNINNDQLFMLSLS